MLVIVKKYDTVNLILMYKLFKYISIIIHTYRLSYINIQYISYIIYKVIKNI